MVEQPAFASIHDPIYVRLAFMAKGREAQMIGDLEKRGLQTF